MYSRFIRADERLKLDVRVRGPNRRWRASHSSGSKRLHLLLATRCTFGVRGGSRIERCRPVRQPETAGTTSKRRPSRDRGLSTAAANRHRALRSTSVPPVRPKRSRTRPPSRHPRSLSDDQEPTPSHSSKFGDLLVRRTRSPRRSFRCGPRTPERPAALNEALRQVDRHNFSVNSLEPAGQFVDRVENAILRRGQIAQLERGHRTVCHGVRRTRTWNGYPMTDAAAQRRIRAYRLGRVRAELVARDVAGGVFADAFNVRYATWLEEHAGVDPAPAGALRLRRYRGTGGDVRVFRAASICSTASKSSTR